MVFCNLSNQGETQSYAGLGTGLARRSVEGLEDPLTFRFRDARPAVGDDEADPAGFLAGLDLDFHRNFAVSQRILKQVSNEPSQEPRVAIHRSTDAANFYAVESRRFFGGEREQVDPFSFVWPLRRIESTCDEQLSDQFVEFLDIAVDASEKIRSGIVVEDRDRHSHTRERCAQLMGGVGEKSGLVGDETFDAIDGSVERTRELRDLVASFDGDAFVETSVPERLDMFLQDFESSCEAAHERVDCDPRRQRQHHDRGEETWNWASAQVSFHDDPAAVAKGEGDCAMPASTTDPLAPAGLGGPGNSLPQANEDIARCIVNRQIDVEWLGDRVCKALESFGWRIGRRGDGLGKDLHLLQPISSSRVVVEEP